MTTRGYNVDEEAVRQAKGTWFRVREQFIRVLKKNPNLLIDLSKDDVENNIGYLGDETKLIYKKARKDIIVAQCKDLSLIHI